MALRLVAALVAMFVLVGGFCWAAGPEEAVTLEELDIASVEQFVSQLDSDLQSYLPDLRPSRLLEAVRQQGVAGTVGEFLEGLLKYIFYEVLAGSSLLGKTVILGAACVVLQQIACAFSGGGVSWIAHTVGYLAIMTLALGSFSLALGAASQAIAGMIDFTHALIPALFTLLAALGGISSTSILHPLILTGLGVVGAVIRNVALPLIFFSVVLGLVSEISERFQVSRLASICRDLAVAVIGLLLTGFIGILTVTGAAAASMDALALRTTRFLTSAFIPVIGRTLADAVETVASTSFFLKSVLGLSGVLVIVALAALPAAKILSLVLVYRLAGALIQPLGDVRVGNLLDRLAGNLLTLFAAVAAVGLMFFLAIGVVIGVGSATLMLR